MFILLPYNSCTCKKTTMVIAYQHVTMTIINWIPQRLAPIGACGRGTLAIYRGTARHSRTYNSHTRKTSPNSLQQAKIQRHILHTTHVHHTCSQSKANRKPAPERRHTCPENSRRFLCSALCKDLRLCEADGRGGAVAVAPRAPGLRRAGGASVRRRGWGSLRFRGYRHPDEEDD